MGEQESEELLPGEEPLTHILAHDISNYLTIIRGQTDLLLADVDESDREDRLHSIKRQAIAADAMLQTIGGVDRGEARSEFEGVAVADLLSNEVDRLQSAYPAATITTDIEEGGRAQADELLLSVFTNLLENAIAHNDSTEPTVHVSARVSNERVIVEIADDGPGLPDGVRDQLEGRGLAHPQSGAHIVRFLVDTYGGDISADADSDGTTITVELPMASE